MPPQVHIVVLKHHSFAGVNLRVCISACRTQWARFKCACLPVVIAAIDVHDGLIGEGYINTLLGAAITLPARHRQPTRLCATGWLIG